MSHEPLTARIKALLPRYDPTNTHPAILLCTSHFNELKGELLPDRKGSSTLESLTGLMIDVDEAQCLVCTHGGARM